MGIGGMIEVKTCEVKTNEVFHQVSHTTRSTAFQNLVVLVISTNALF